MKLKVALFIIFTLTLLSFGGWLTILMNTDPASINAFLLGTFYLSIFLFVTGIASFIGFAVRYFISNREVLYAHLWPSFRQGLLMGIIAAGLLFLQSLRVLSPIDASAFILAILLIELFFRAKPKHRATEKEELV